MTIDRCGPSSRRTHARARGARRFAFLAAAGLGHHAADFAAAGWASLVALCDREQLDDRTLVDQVMSSSSFFVLCASAPPAW